MSHMSVFDFVFLAPSSLFVIVDPVAQVSAFPPMIPPDAGVADQDR